MFAWNINQLSSNSPLLESPAVFRSLADLRVNPPSTALPDDWFHKIGELLDQDREVYQRARDWRNSESRETHIDLAGTGDKQLLSLENQFAFISDLHGRWADELAEIMIIVQSSYEGSLPLPEMAEPVIARMNEHIADLRWVELSCRTTADMLGSEYDRRHPEAMTLPFEPIDMGPTNSGRLPPVL